MYEQEPNHAIYGHDAATIIGPATPYNGLIECMIAVSVLFDLSKTEIYFSISGLQPI